jgi:hypothetical protein
MAQSVVLNFVFANLKMSFFFTFEVKINPTRRMFSAVRYEYGAYHQHDYYYPKFAHLVKTVDPDSHL